MMNDAAVEGLLLELSKGGAQNDEAFLASVETALDESEAGDLAIAGRGGSRVSARIGTVVFTLAAAVLTSQSTTD